MCLIVFAHYTHPKYPFILLANRDEYYERPTQQLGFWDEEAALIGGRDLRAGGHLAGDESFRCFCGRDQRQDVGRTNSC